MTVTYGAGPSGKKRPPNRPSGRDLDRMVFGPSEDDVEDVEPEPRVRSRQAREDAGYPGAGRSGRDYSRLPEESGVYPRVEDNRRGPLILAAAFALVLVFGLVVWNAYRDGVRPEDSEVAPQLAEAGPFKTRPDPADEPVDPVAEASVFDTVEPSSSATGPDAPEAVASASEASEPAAPDVPVPSATEVRPEPPGAASEKAQPSAALQPPPASSSPRSAPSPAAAPTPVAAVSPAPATVSAPAAAVRSAPAGGPAFSAGGRYVVQLGAPSSEAAAQAEWDRRRRAMPELLGGAERFIVRADVNGRTVYRVRAGSFATAADADAFCGMIKARGGDCFRTEK